ncbi:uncharacterized protein LOC127568373 [Pristis pectinata]|uniref:uncharacterized protein LOC127568373 n=1 Tax=Pristis pectinata TaxID=685728 RepID=UPI00223CF9CE|nr:uncharacterized protein LOC127568373 [Pristis pectinata]
MDQFNPKVAEEDMRALAASLSPIATSFKQEKEPDLDNNEDCLLTKEEGKVRSGKHSMEEKGLLVLQQDSGIPYNTKKATAWGVRVWDEWGKTRNSYIMEQGVQRNELFLYVPELCYEITHDELNFWLCRFVLEVRRQDGSEYPPNSLRLLCCSILRHLRENCRRSDIDFFNKLKPDFAEFRTTLDNRMKQLQRLGIGLVRKQAQPYTEDDEERLWQVVFHLHDAKSYSYAAYFYVCKVFALCAAKDHHKLTVDQFKFGCDMISEYVEFTGRPSNPQDSLDKLKIVQTRQYADSPNPRCIVSLLRRYLSMIPSEGPFYRRPVPGTMQFSEQAIGVHTLERYSKEICEAAGISGHHTGHSGRVSSATTLYNRGFDEQSIKERTGPTGSLAKGYRRPSPAQMKAMSDCLQPPNPLKKISACSPSSSTSSEDHSSSQDEGPSNIIIISEDGTDHPQEITTIFSRPEVTITEQDGVLKIEIPPRTPPLVPLSSLHTITKLKIVKGDIVLELNL